MNYLIGVDLGTSGTKTVLFDTEGTVISSATVEYPMYQPKNGWAEQAPEDWWDATMRTTKKVIEDSGVDSKDIKGMGISGQMHGLVMLDENGSVLRRSIIWCDQRTARECEEITERVGAKRLIEITANPALPGFTASKILWVRNHEPEIYAKCRHILLPKDYVRYMLTGEFATEVSDASGMQLLDIPNRCWSDEVLEKLDIDKSMLAKVYESPEITGYITEEAAKLTGKEVVLDAYCGIGTIGLTAADHAKQVVGVELNRDAVQDAIGNARHNGVKNARFFAADATRWIGEAAAAGEKADVIFMDPPREGSTPEFLASVARMAPKRVVYVSCNPVTLARDLATLTKLGYKAEGFTPVDMFPHTEHVEAIVSLQREI